LKNNENKRLNKYVKEITKNKKNKNVKVETQNQELNKNKNKNKKMFSLTERNQNNSLTIRKKIVLYEDYLQIKNAYINLKEKNNKLKGEKQKLELLLNQYQSYISDYKTSNNTIKLIFKKLEKKYKDSYSLFQKKLFSNMSISIITNALT
jgi:hypothetical protein